FRPSDVPALFPLLDRHFPEENALLGWTPAAFDRTVRRIYRWDARLFLALLSLAGRPVFRFFAIEADRRLVGTTLLTYAARAGFVSLVMVDGPYRRRGFARRLVGAAIAATARSGRRHVALDVLDSNAPARALYAALGFRRLRSLTLWSGPVGSVPPPLPAAAHVRPFRRSDAGPIAAIASAQLRPEVAEVLPVGPGDFDDSAWVTRALASESEAWVAVDGAGAPRGFVRATASATTTAGHLAAPVIADELDPATEDALLAAALGWLAGRGRSTLVCELADTNARGAALLGRSGFVPALAAETQVRAV
ncbi:MAG TPA: GNAT family N-acetyltransferase, partial [Thermoplasmata archaeon]|nr:GNAT family N-acetyltransferase [Thermoplasmata archaeon]